MTVPPGIGRQVTTRFTSVLDFSQLRAELPINGLSFSKVLNGSGPWEGSLDVEDLGVRKSFWQEATLVNRTAVWVDVGGALLYGGRVTGRRYAMSTGKVALSGGDMAGYFSQRIQAQDYTAYEDPEGHHWATTGASALRIAFYVLRQAMAKAYSIPIEIVASGEEPGEAFWITFSAPEAQQQTIASMLSQLQELGYLVGVDYACDVAYVKGVPTVAVTLSYPRRGTAAPLVIDLTNALDLEYDEDGTEQADRVVAQAGATIVRSKGAIYQPTAGAGYPLLEAELSYSALAPSGNNGAVLEAYASGALATRAYPLLAPVVTLPLFGVPSIFELDVGDDVWLYVPVGAGGLPLNNPRFPEGLRFLFRIVRIDVKVEDEGVSTMALTLNLPPSEVPVEPPELDREAKEAEEREELERREKEAKEKEELEAKEKEEREAAERKAEEELQSATEAEAEAAVKEAEKAVSEATSEKQKKEAERVLKKAEEILGKSKKPKSKSEKERVKQEAEENKRESEIVKIPSSGGTKLGGPVEPLVARSEGSPYTPSGGFDAVVALSFGRATGASKAIKYFVSVDGVSALEGKMADTGVGAGAPSVTFPVKAGGTWEVSLESESFPVEVFSTYWFFE